MVRGLGEAIVVLGRNKMRTTILYNNINDVDSNFCTDIRRGRISIQAMMPDDVIPMEAKART